VPPDVLFAGFAAALAVVLTWICIARGRLLFLEDHVTRAEYPWRFWYAVVSRAIAGVVIVVIIAYFRF